MSILLKKGGGGSFSGGYGISNNIIVQLDILVGIKFDGWIQINMQIKVLADLN